MAQDQRSPYGRLALRWAVIAVGVAVASNTSTGISYDGPGSWGPHGWGTLALVALALGLLNIWIKPLLVLFTLPFVVLTLGLGMWIINACLFKLAGALVPGFVVAGFSSALWGALVVSIISMLAHWLFKAPPRPHNTRVLGGVSGPPPAARRDDDVIDV